MRLGARALTPVLLAASLLASSQARAGEADPKAAFERLKTLEGTWQGRAGHGETKQQATVTYRVASGGTVVQETLFPGTPHEMISMYHLADGQLVMTHYCSAGNQPRLKLDTKASTADKLVFAFDGGSNLDPAKDGHVHAGTLTLGAEAIKADWSFWAAGKEAGHNVFDLERSK
jgi:hypothetical protein